MANGMTTEAIEKSVSDLLAHPMLERQSNHAYHEMAPQFVIRILIENGIEEGTARRIQFDILYLSEVVRGFTTPRSLGTLAFKQEQLDQLATQMKEKQHGRY